MKFLRQPEDSSLCGQTCVAMIADISLDESIKLFGTRGVTTTKMVASVLKKCGFKCSDRLTRIKSAHEITPSKAATTLPELCIVKIRWLDNPNSSHWVIYNSGMFYDPDVGILKPKKYDKRKHYMRITSYLEIQGKEAVFKFAGASVVL